MLGNLKFNIRSANEDIRNDFSLFYCSLCQSLRKKGSLLSSLYINYEMTFILHGLKNHIEGTATKTYCPTKLFTKTKNTVRNETIDRAADLSYLLSYLYTQDFLADEKPTMVRRLVASFLSKKLKKNATKVLQSLQPETIATINEYMEITKNDIPDYKKIWDKSFDLASKLALEVAKTTNIETEKLKTFTNFFGNIGTLLAQYDPLADIEKDLKANKSFNPIVYNSQNQKVPIETSYSQFLDTYWETEKIVKAGLAEMENFVVPSFKSAMELTLRNNSFVIQHVTKNIFNKFENKELEQRDFSMFTCYEMSSKFALEKYLLIGSVFPLMACDEMCDGGAGENCCAGGSGGSGAPCDCGCAV